MVGGAISCNVLEKHVAYGYGGYHPGKVGKQTAGHGVAGVLDAHTAEVDGKNVEGGIGGTLEYAGQTSYERVGTIVGHSLKHQPSGTASRQRLHQCRRQGSDKVGVQPTLPHAPCHTIDEHVHGSRRAEYSHRHEYGDEIGYYSNGSLEPLLGSLYEGVVDIDAAEEACQDEG